MKRFFRYFSFIKKINLFQYFYLNYFCKRIIRIDNSKIIPYKNAVFDIEPGARIIIKRGNLEIGNERLHKSKSETLVRLRKDAVWSAHGGCCFSYGTTLEVLEKARLQSDFFTMNTGSTLISAKEIQIGHDVMIARNVVIYDSDFHPLFNESGEQINPPKIVKIGKHVWIGTGAIILKGTVIGDGAVIPAGSMVRGNIEANHIYREKSYDDKKHLIVRWER